VIKIEGYIKLFRHIIDNPIYTKSPLYLKVFERLILEANHKCIRIPYNKITKLIKRGEKLTSIRQISEWVAWYERGILRSPNPKTISEILNWLVENNMIEIYNKGNTQVTVKNGKKQNESNNRETHYNIVNYCIYQSKEHDESNSQVTTKFPTKINEGIQQLDTNKNVKNKKNVKNNISNEILYGEFQKVKLTTEEYEKLLKLLKNQTQEYIDRLDGYIASKGVKYKSHYATILNWHRKDEKDKEGKNAEHNGDNGKYEIKADGNKYDKWGNIIF
jgi:DNA-binding transcriptional regulator YhcF (GntR family)